MAGRRDGRSRSELRDSRDILARLLAGMGLDDRLREREALTVWAELVGPEIAKRSKALRIRSGILFVRGESAAWTQELHFMKERILAKYAERLGEGTVKDIRFT